VLSRLSVIVRSVEARVAAATGSTERRLRGGSGAIPVLMYHRILPDDFDARGIEPGMFVRASTFDRHLAWLTRRFRVSTLGQILGEPAPPTESVAAITFDDGFRDNLDVAWPILERHDIRATIFVVSEWCSGPSGRADTFLRPDEIGSLARDGMEFGAHTATHPHLDRLPDPEAESEMRRSRDAVETWTGRPCRLFAYPYGDHHSRTVDLALSLFDAAVTVGGGWWRPGTHPPGRLPRVAIHEDMTWTRALFERRLASRM
jgi:peptidoglycan/xylan/chitin deacetylase (PgdA/CDA1 family)